MVRRFVWLLCLVISACGTNALGPRIDGGPDGGAAEEDGGADALTTDVGLGGDDTGDDTGGESTQPEEGCFGAEENIDDDRDGLIDETCDCVVGSTKPCYSGPLRTRDRGVCRAGSQNLQLHGRRRSLG